MKTTKSFWAMALCAGAMLWASGAMAGYITTQKAVEPGVWTSDYDGAMKYADNANIPMVVFWANAGCGHCEGIEKEMNKELFTTWMAEKRPLMVFVESNTKVYNWIQAKAPSRLKSYPFMAVYWPRNSQGELVLECFSAYTGNMGLYGANSKDSNIQQIIDTLEFVLGDWDPNGGSGPAPAYYTVNFVVDTTKAKKVKGDLTQRVKSENAATAPTFTVKKGWEFTGWDKAFNSVTSDLTVTAKFKSTASDPDPVYYTVNFVVNEEKGTASGDLSQQVLSGKAAVEPTVIANDGWKFTGWDKPFSKVKGDLTVTALFKQPADRDEIDPEAFFKKAKNLEAIAYEDGELFGRAAITLGKYNAKKQYLKATFKITSFAGKSYSKSLNLTPDEYGDFLEVAVAFKSPIGAMVFNLYNGEDGYEIFGMGDDYSVESGEDIVIGGELENKEMTFAAKLEDLEPENNNYEFLYDLPSVTAMVKRGKTLNFGSAPKITYQRLREGGETRYELADIDEARYPNLNAVKLTYKPATGAFSGSFKIYASNESAVDDGKKPTLKTYTAKFSGYVVNGSGVGMVSVKIGKKTYTGTCSLD